MRRKNVGFGFTISLGSDLAIDFRIPFFMLDSLSRTEAQEGPMKINSD